MTIKCAAGEPGPLAATLPDVAVTCYSIPIGLFDAFPGRPLILRTADAADPRRLLGPVAPAGVAYLQVTALAQDMAPLSDWGAGLAIDLLMADPATEFPLLYQCTGLLAFHPVRVTIPLLPGLARAVKLALSLDFAVRLVGHQPGIAAVAEARQALAAYLHSPTVAQPVEPFHSLLFGLVHDSSGCLWSILEQDPDTTRWLDDQGEAASDLAPESLTTWRDTLMARGAECCGCPWFPTCGGYFQWPRIGQDCTDIRLLFADLQSAATELRADLTAGAAAQD